MRWSYITGLGLGSLAMAILALWLASMAVPLAIQLEDPTAVVSEACARGQLAQCSKDREAAKLRSGLLLNATAMATMGCLVLAGMGTLALARHRREEDDKARKKGPQLLGPSWSDRTD